jgi:hypothetical protein
VEPGARQQLAQHERKAGGHRVDRQRLALEVGDLVDRGPADQAEQAVVDRQEREQVGVVGDLGLALTLLVRDRVVDRER